MIKIVLLFVVIAQALLAEVNQTNYTFVKQTALPVVHAYYKEANASENNISKFNMKDWEANFKKSGIMTAGIIGNTAALFGGTAEGKMAASGDLSKMKTSELQNNPDFKTNRSIGAMDSVLQSEILANVVANAFGKPGSKAKNLKCYISRDVGQTYMCTAPGNSLMVSSAMGGRDALSKLKSDCEGQCFSQSSCINMQQNEQNITAAIPAKEFTLSSSTPSFSFTIPTRSDLTINSITLAETAKVATVKYSISYIDRQGRRQTLIDNMLSLASRIENMSLYVNDIASSITVSIALAPPYPVGATVTVKLDGIAVKYHSNAQYICPSAQDITGMNGGEFANVCRAGKKTTLTRLTGALEKTFEICASAVHPGQNPDGTFYQRSACESVCRRQYECKLLPAGGINFESLKGFREGCIENTSLDCNNFNEDCKNARLNPQAKVVNELVFGGDLRPTSTIVNGMSTGVERPRLSLSNMVPTLGPDGGTYGPNDAQFEAQRKEEWKDKAYTDMMSNALWNRSGITIGENSSANHAYGIKLKTGSFYGYAGTSVRALTWKLKPAAHDVGAGETFELYAVIRAIVQNYRYDRSGTGEKVPHFDEIWFIKTGPGDSFKPFYYGEDAYSMLAVKDDYGLTSFQYRPNADAVGRYATFTEGAWGGISGEDEAEAFKSETFEANNAYWEYEVLGNMEGKYDALPGLIRKLEKAGDYTEIVHYDGPIDYMSASTIVKFSVAAAYSNAPLSYRSIKEMVESGNIATIYEVGNENAYPRSFRGDGEKDNSVTMYMYGKSNNGSAYFDIRPRKDHVGKKGFIFVFGE